MVAMFALNPALAAIVVLFLAGSIAAAFGLGRRGWRSHRLAMQSTDDLASRIQEGLASARAIALFDGTGRNEDSLRQASSRHAENLARAGSVRAVVTPFLGLAEYIGIVIVLVVGGWSMLHGTLTAGGLVAFLAYMEMSADPLARAARIVPGLQKAFVAASRLGGLLEETDSPPESPDAVRPARVRGDVVVSGLSFRYPGRSRPALAELAFSVRAGESVAVVGPTGSGKSTFLDLLLRLQLPESGRIVIDEWDLGRLSLSSWRSLVGVVPQDTRLLDRTVSENIALGVAAPAAIHAAAEAAGIGDWIESLPHGYATRLGEGGAFLSGGERQRIAVARLFLHDPRLLVLDEPTSSLDADSEAEVRAVLKKLRRGRTCFIVSHRPAVLEDADKVLLLLDGRQLAFGEPERVWLDFPDLRALFPPAWASLRARGPLPRPTARA
jgi:subfamily B ATP-binding cassette protein MsbA